MIRWSRQKHLMAHATHKDFFLFYRSPASKDHRYNLSWIRSTHQGVKFSRHIFFFNSRTRSERRNVESFQPIYLYDLSRWKRTRGGHAIWITRAGVIQYFFLENSLLSKPERSPESKGPSILFLSIIELFFPPHSSCIPLEKSVMMN